jgi:signal transduction histidine kinase
VRKIQLAGKHLLGLISDILDLSKIEAGRMDIHLETFDVADMIDIVLGTVGPMIARNGNEISVVCPPSIGFIHADLTKFRQILLNLLSNAAKFTDKGTIRVAVSRLLQGSQQMIQFVISDSGIGMTQGQVTQLFQAFSQGDSSTSRRYGGTGLGLAITKAFVDMLGGTIEVQSKLAPARSSPSACPSSTRATCPAASARRPSTPRSPKPPAPPPCGRVCSRSSWPSPTSQADLDGTVESSAVPGIVTRIEAPLVAS